MIFHIFSQIRIGAKRNNLSLHIEFVTSVPMQDKILEVNKILESRPLITSKYLNQALFSQKITEDCDSNIKIIRRLFLQYANLNPKQVLFVYTLIKKYPSQLLASHIQSQQIERQLKSPEYLQQIINGYGTIQQIISLQKEINTQFQQLIPIAIFSQDLSAKQVYQTLKAPRQNKIGTIRNRQQILGITTNQSVLTKSKSFQKNTNNNKSKNTIKKQEPITQTKPKQTKIIANNSKKIINKQPQLPRVNTNNTGNKIFKQNNATVAIQDNNINNNKTSLNTYVKYDSEDEERVYGQQSPTKKVQSGISEMEIEEQHHKKQQNAHKEQLKQKQGQDEEDDYEQYEMLMKKMNDKKKSENISTNLPKQSSLNNYMKPKNPPNLQKKTTDKAQVTNKPKVLNNGQKTLFAFMKSA